MITGDVTFVYRGGRYMYVKDQTGGLLIYDYSNPVITTTYNEGDVISGGLVGSRSIFHGLNEFLPNPRGVHVHTDTFTLTIGRMFSSPRRLACASISATR